MKRLFILLLCALLPSLLAAQTPASVTWNLTSDAAVSSTTGNVAGQTQTLSNLAVQNYTTNGAQRTSPDGAGTWPGESTELATRYMEFRVAPSGTNSSSSRRSRSTSG